MQISQIPYVCVFPPAQAQRPGMQPDELSSETQRSVTGVGEEEKAISTFEEAFRRIKEATGVTDTRVLYTQRERERERERDIAIVPKILMKI